MGSNQWLTPSSEGLTAIAEVKTPCRIEYGPGSLPRFTNGLGLNSKSRKERGTGSRKTRPILTMTEIAQAICRKSCSHIDRFRALLAGRLGRGFRMQEYMAFRFSGGSEIHLNLNVPGFNPSATVASSGQVSVLCGQFSATARVGARRRLPRRPLGGRGIA